VTREQKVTSQKLTSHELGFYRDLADAPIRQSTQKRKESETPYNYQKDYFYLFLKKVAVRGVVSGVLIREKDCDPVGRLPTIFKIKNVEKTPLSEEEQKLRTPPPVKSLVNAKNESIHEANVQKVRKGKKFMRRCKICNVEISWDTDKSFDVCLAHRAQFDQQKEEERVHQLTQEYAEFNQIRDTTLVCPHCFKEDDDWWEYRWKDGDIEDIECGYCEKTFEVQLEVQYQLTTTRK